MAFDTLVFPSSSARSQVTLSAQLEQELSRIEDAFRVDSSKLRDISLAFEEELREGLDREGANISMNLTWVLGWPSGDETGSFLTLDLGGTNLRTCWVTLNGRGTETVVDQESYALPDGVKSGSAEALWNLIAESLHGFLESRKLKGTAEQPLPFAFTFSYPVLQDYIDHGELQTWTKGFDIDGVEGHDVAEQFRAAADKQKLPVRLVALVNDTTGAMIASAYNDPETIAGAIFGTGCNAAYVEDCGSIAKLNADLPPDRLMAINCEYGAFDNSHRALPRTKYDVAIDEASPRPGEQTFEKLSAGLYLGELFRLVMLDMHEQDLVFSGQDVARLQEPYCLDTAFLSGIENDQSTHQTDTAAQFHTLLNIDPTPQELAVARRLAEAIAVRAARLCACGIAAICRKKGIERGHVAADGSVANKHPKFKQRWAAALGEVLHWPAERTADPVTITSAEDGSGIGAAVVAAMTMARFQAGDRTGIKEA